jgi:hypothetical protein
MRKKMDLGEKKKIEVDRCNNELVINALADVNKRTMYSEEFSKLQP